MENRFESEDWKKGKELQKRRRKTPTDVRHFLVAAIIQAYRDCIMTAELHQMIDELTALVDMPESPEREEKMKELGLVRRR
jgi:hypothetical protein